MLLETTEFSPPSPIAISTYIAKINASLQKHHFQFNTSQVSTDFVSVRIETARLIYVQDSQHVPQTFPAPSGRQNQSRPSSSNGTTYSFLRGFATCPTSYGHNLLWATCFSPRHHDNSRSNNDLTISQRTSSCARDMERRTSWGLEILFGCYWCFQSYGVRW